MLDIRNLEDRWKKYNKKRKRPFYLVISSVLLLLFAIAITQFKHIDILKSFSFMTTNKAKSNLTETANVSTKTELIDASSNTKTVFLLNEEFTQLELKKAIITKPQEKSIEKKTSMLPIDEDELFTENDISKPIIKKKPVNFIKIANSNAYKDVERRFRRSHNINDSIFLANMYYKKKNYQKAIHWSMQTNKLDNNIEESWLIFAKSKVKLGHKNEAMRVLKAYIKRSNSYEAKKLLKKLRN
jgi:tetratricopeptide (TPR) repeat protein